MDLKIEIPDIVEDIEITMEEAFTYVSSRKGVPLQNLIELYNNCKNIKQNFLQDVDIFQKKRKHEFASFNKHTIFHIGSCSFLYYYHQNYFTKVYVYDDDFKKNIVLSKIMAEIYFQKFVTCFNSPDKCNFCVPKIYNYGFIQTHEFTDKIVFYFTMENTNAITLDKLNTITIDNINKVPIHYGGLKYKAMCINTCLKKRGFFHNDLHSNNIMINQMNNEMFIIDYGESSTYDNNLLGFQEHKYCIDCDHEKKINKYCC